MSGSVVWMRTLQTCKRTQIFDIAFLDNPGIVTHDAPPAQALVFLSEFVFSFHSFKTTWPKYPRALKRVSRDPKCYFFRFDVRHYSSLFWRCSLLYSNLQDIIPASNFHMDSNPLDQ